MALEIPINIRTLLAFLFECDSCCRDHKVAASAPHLAVPNNRIFAVIVLRSNLLSSHTLVMRKI